MALDDRNEGDKEDIDFDRDFDKFLDEMSKPTLREKLQNIFFGRNLEDWKMKYYSPVERMAMRFAKNLFIRNMRNIFCYDSRFDEFDRRELKKKGIKPNQTNCYDIRLNPKDVVAFVENNFSPGLAKSYLEWYLSNFKDNPPFSEEVTEHFPLPIPDGEIVGFNDPFAARTFIHLKEKGKTPQELKEYSPSFGVVGTMELAEWGISPEKANELAYAFKGNSKHYGVFVANLAGIGIEDLKKYPDLHNGLSILLEGIWLWTKFPNTLTPISTGSKGILMRHREFNQAWKLAADISKERDFLSRIRKNNSHLENTVELIEEFEPWQSEELLLKYLRLEYVEGDSLGSILQGGKIEDTSKILDYGLGIMRGLMEARRGGIRRHRDIRPKNILIDNARNRPVVVDYGLATMLDEKLYSAKHGFSEWNDLVGLGQTLYCMATGDLQSLRNCAFSEDEPHGIKPEALAKVDEIVDPKLRALTRDCLLAEDDDCIELGRIVRKHYGKGFRGQDGR